MIAPAAGILATSKSVFFTATVMLLLPRSHGPATYLAVASSAPHDLQREAEETGNLHDAADPEATTAVVVAAAVARSSGMDGVGSGSGIGSPPQVTSCWQFFSGRGLSVVTIVLEGIPFGDIYRTCAARIADATPQQY